MTTRTTAAALAAGVLVVALAGCTSATSESEPPAAATSQAAEPSSEPSTEPDTTGSAEPSATALELACSYEGDADPATPGGLPYVLVLTDRAGRLSEVSSWRAAPGQTARLAAATALPRDEIAAIEIRLDDGGTVVMRAELDEP